jgi:hypothetical protein
VNALRRAVWSALSAYSRLTLRLNFPTPARAAPSCRVGRPAGLLYRRWQEPRARSNRLADLIIHAFMKRSDIDTPRPLGVGHAQISPWRIDVESRSRPRLTPGTPMVGPVTGAPDRRGRQ